MIGHEKAPPGRRGKPFLSYVRASLRYGTKVKRKYYKSNFDDPKFYPRILLVDELLRDDFRTLVVVSDGLRVLEAVENAFQGVVDKSSWLWGANMLQSSLYQSEDWLGSFRSAP